MSAMLIVSVLLIIALVIAHVAAWRKIRWLRWYINAKEQHRLRVARVLVSRFRWMEKAHKEDHDKLEPFADCIDRQGQAARIMRGSFNGLVKAYGDAADDAERFIVWEFNADELLKEADAIAATEARNE